ncbi:MAG: Rpp14/Pop5 family protein [Nanoarchaeota archaeon]
MIQNNNSNNKLKSSIKEIKLKPLIPTLRTKKRFIKIKIESSNNFDFKTLSDKLSYEINYWIGAIDYGKAGIWFLKDKFNQKEQTLIIKTSLPLKDKLIASLLLINKINNIDVKLNIIKVSGTLKGLENNKNKT